jgi:lipopolysaccharide export system protein LptC
MGPARQFLPALTLTLVLSLLSACKKPPAVNSTAGNTTATNNDRPELTMETLNIQSYNGPHLEWQLAAPYGEVFNQKNLMHVKNLTVDLFKDAQPSSRITADEGLTAMGNSPTGVKPVPVTKDILLHAGDMYLNGHVVVVSTEGNTVTTDWAYYNKATDLITSSAPVQVARKDSITSGFGLEATPDLKHLKIFNETLVIKDQGETSGKL